MIYSVSEFVFALQTTYTKTTTIQMTFFRSNKSLSNPLSTRLLIWCLFRSMLILFLPFLFFIDVSDWNKSSNCLTLNDIGIKERSETNERSRLPIIYIYNAMTCIRGAHNYLLNCSNDASFWNSSFVLFFYLSVSCSRMFAFAFFNLFNLEQFLGVFVAAILVSTSKTNITKLEKQNSVH